jgi:ATP-dependent Zn protease
MATAELTGTLRVGEESVALAAQLRRLSRVATLVASFTSPALFVYFWKSAGWSIGWSLAATLGAVAAFRGLIDVGIRRLIPWPSLFGTEEARLQEEDIVSRRRAWFWERKYQLVWYAILVVSAVFLVRVLRSEGASFPHSAAVTGHFLTHKVLLNKTVWLQLAILPLFFLINFAILFGPLLMMGLSQMRGYEPGDANWGVRLPDVRGQAEAKEEVRKIVTLWQSGETFERAGGKRERGLIFHGPPGTGKTMLAKAIATSFNAPFIAMPGSGFAQTFIGMDAVIVRFLARKAKRLARKWGGQCIVFIDEIDAVGMRRQSLQGQNMTPSADLFRPESFHGPWGALNASGDLIIESEAWRNWLFEQRAPERRSPYPPFVQKVVGIVNQVGGMGLFGGTGQLALNQLLVVMDGMDNPPFGRRLFTNKLNTWLDATYVVPRRIGKVPLRLPPPHPRKEQIYFIGATNVPLQNLDPALTRPGRMGRHVWFRTPTKDDRLDIFDLYLDKVAHEADFDTPQRRDEIARITNGYSPAMIDQACSMALTYAQHDGRMEFGWRDLLEAMSVIESGAAVNIKYVAHETRAIAIHEAGHASAAHLYRPELESSRLSIRMRPDSSLGHHQSFQREERFTQWNRELFGDLVHVLGAMAAEYVFYGENSNGVGGDLGMATSHVAWMVGTSGMGPPRLDLPTFADETPEQTRRRITKRFEQIGLQLMNRTRGSADFHADPIAAILNDPAKRSLAAQTLGQAFVTAYNFILANKDKVEKVAEELIREREIYGDKIKELLDAQRFEKPQIDWAKAESWPAEIDYAAEEPWARTA